MARYIDADKLLKEFEVDTSKDVMDISDIVFGAVTSIIEKQPTADVVEVGWIDVNERLPKDYEKVLCLCQANIYEVLVWDNIQQTWFHDATHSYFKTFVTHWMPLPEPPKGATDTNVGCK